MAVFLAGGPIASGLTALAGTCLAVSGYANSFVVSCAGVSTIVFVRSFIAARVKIGGILLANDAMLIRKYWHQRFAELSHPGTSLASCIAMRDLCGDLNASVGVIHMTLWIAVLQAALGDLDAARATLSDPVLSAKGRGTAGCRIQSFLQTSLDLDTGESPADEVLRDVAIKMAGDDYAISSLFVAAAIAALGRGESAAALLERAIAHSQASGVVSLTRHVEAVSLLSNPPDDLAASCRRLLDAQGAEQLDPLTALWLASSTTELLVAQKKLRDARSMFREALRRLNHIAATIPSETTRLKFQIQFSAPLKAAVEMFDDELPLFVPELG